MDFITGTILFMGYPGLFIATLLMFMIFPLPAQPIMLLSGVLIAQGKMAFLPALLFSTAGGIAGAFINYFLAYRLGRKWLVNRLSFFIREKHLSRLEWFFGRYGERALYIGLSVPSLGQVITLPAGLAGMELRRFGWIVFWGTLTWCAYLLGLGIFFGDHIHAIESNLHLVGLTLLVLVLLGSVSLYILRRTIFKYYRTIRWRDANNQGRQTD